MIKARVIPILYLMNGLIVRSERFQDFKVIGNPLSELERYSEWLADELVYIDITREGDHDIRRDDHKVKNIGDKLELLQAISKAAFMPLTFGGRIQTLEEIDTYLLNGADKIILNSAAWREPGLITRAAESHGSQAVMVGIDVKNEGGEHAVYVDQGRTPTGENLRYYARKLEDSGAGEILVNSIDRDGTGEGYDTAAIRIVSDAVKIPVIAAGGVGSFSHFQEGLSEGGASAIAAGNIFHFTEHSYKRAKKLLKDRGYNIRYPYPA